MMLTETLSKEDVNAIINQNFTLLHPVEMAIEVNVVVIVFQRVPNNASLFAIVTCRLQGNNETGSFINDFCGDACEVKKMMDSFTFTCFATCGVS